MLFDTYYRPLVIFASGFLADMDACEDIVQNVFFSFWEKSPKIENESAIGPYLYTAVKNGCYNQLRHQKIKNRYAETFDLTAWGERPKEHEELKCEVTLLVYKAINKLPARRKLVVELMLKGMRNQEISEHMGIQLQTVKDLKSKAYKDIRSLLLKEGI